MRISDWSSDVCSSDLIGPSLQAAASAVLGAQAPTYSLAVWHGWNAPLQMSVIAFIAGCLLYVALLGYFRRCERTPLMRGISGQRLFDRAQPITTADVPAWLGPFFPTRSTPPKPQTLQIVDRIVG